MNPRFLIVSQHKRKGSKKVLPELAGRAELSTTFSSCSLFFLLPLLFPSSAPPSHTKTTLAASPPLLYPSRTTKAKIKGRDEFFSKRGSCFGCTALSKVKCRRSGLRGVLASVVDPPECIGVHHNPLVNLITGCSGSLLSGKASVRHGLKLGARVSCQDVVTRIPRCLERAIIRGIVEQGTGGLIVQ